MCTNNINVYVFKSNQNKQVEIDGESFDFKKGDVYYVGEGNSNRISHMNRNDICNLLTKELDGYLEVVKSGLTKDEALKMETELEEKYRKYNFLANKSMTGRSMFDTSKIPEIKFLLELDRQQVIDVSFSDLRREFGISYLVLSKLQDSFDFIIADPYPPENLSEILEKYKPRNDIDTKIYGEVNYVFDLVESGLLNMSIKDLCNEMCIYHSQFRDAQDLNTRIRPSENKLAELIVKYGYQNRDEGDITRGKILSCINAKEKYRLQVTDQTIADMFNVKPSVIADIKRGKRELIKPVALSKEEIGTLFSYETEYLMPEKPLEKNLKFCEGAINCEAS